MGGGPKRLPVTNGDEWCFSADLSGTGSGAAYTMGVSSDTAAAADLSAVASDLSVAAAVVVDDETRVGTDSACDVACDGACDGA